MCGINGFNWKDEELIQDMNKTISHRGPDATDVYCADKISLGHNRLSIIDLSETANQPMWDVTKKVAIIFNGEIYNYEDLKKELLGYPFKTKSDTEVILAAYSKWGIRAFEKFNGMFALAIWDSNEDALYLARDQVGVKPLFYFWDGKKLIFSSEIKSILMHKEVGREINYQALNAFMRILYVPRPDTMFRTIKKLPQGHILYLRGGQINITQFFKLSTPERKPSEELITTIKEAVQRSVKRQLVSDRPVGIYLSGGLDSATVLHCMSEKNKEIESFSVGFYLPEGSEEEKFNKDAVLARQVAKIYGTKHNELIVTPKEVADSLEKVISHCDDPISNATSIPMYFLAEFTKRKVDVVLSGDGGDELFGGYDRYRYARRAEIYQKLPHFLRALKMWKVQNKLDTPAGEDMFKAFMFQKNNVVGQVMNPSFLKNNDFIFNKYWQEDFDHMGGLEAADKLMRADFLSWMPDQSLALADKMSMSVALEQRVPLLDLELVRLLSSIPSSQKLTSVTNKKLLRKAFEKDLPEFLFNQPKRGWFAPGAKWLRDPQISKFAREVLSEGYYNPTSTIFDWRVVNKMLDDHIEKRVYNANILWAIMTFQIWAYKCRVLA